MKQNKLKENVKYRLKWDLNSTPLRFSEARETNNPLRGKLYRYVSRIKQLFTKL